MPLRLYVDAGRWRAHLQRVRDAHPGIVPVLKGNGYGFGVPRLAEEASRLGVGTVAVGTYSEVAPVAAACGGPFTGAGMGLSPRRPFERPPTPDPQGGPTLGRPPGPRAPGGPPPPHEER